MSAEHEDHGHTPAAWTLVGIVIAGFTVGGRPYCRSASGRRHCWRCDLRCRNCGGQSHADDGHGRSAEVINQDFLISGHRS